MSLGGGELIGEVVGFDPGEVEHLGQFIVRRRDRREPRCQLPLSGLASPQLSGQGTLPSLASGKLSGQFIGQVGGVDPDSGGFLDQLSLAGPQLGQLIGQLGFHGHHRLRKRGFTGRQEFRQLISLGCQPGSHLSCLSCELSCLGCQSGSQVVRLGGGGLELTGEFSSLQCGSIHVYRLCFTACHGGGQLLVELFRTPPRCCCVCLGSGERVAQVRLAQQRRDDLILGLFHRHLGRRQTITGVRQPLLGLCRRSLGRSQLRCDVSDSGSGCR
mmetsp:Transcript_5312/g.13537  ORF Transcript_5312/g.13537 Transcript_5312/m.13537 type:complete len:272 (-) Transcript_5312:1086-1901(-)